MIGTEYQVRLRNGAGTVVAIFDLADRQSRLRYSRKVNQVGSYQFRLSGDDDRVSLFALDGQLEVWRHDVTAGIAWYCDFEGFHRPDESWLYSDAKGLAFALSSGPDYKHLLQRRRIIPAAGSEMTSIVATAADSAIVTLVTNNAGSGAAAPRQMSGLQITAALGTASTVTRDFRQMDELLRAVQSLAADARAQTIGVDFDVLGPGRDPTLSAAQFRFKTYTPYLGLDRTVGNGVNAPVVFALERGNMALPKFGYRRQRETTRVYVAGTGEGKTQIVQEVAATEESASTWNRIEAWLDARDQSETNALLGLGRAYLRDRVGKSTFDFEALESPATRYGLDYFLGDRVTGRYRGVDYNVQVRGVTVTLDEHGEKIDLELDDV